MSSISDSKNQNPGLPSFPVVTTPQGMPVAPAGAKTPPRYFRSLIKERRDHIRSFLSKGIISAARIASILGVSEGTIKGDLKAIRNEDKRRLTKASGADHVLDLLAIIEQIQVNASADYMAIKDNSPRGSSVKAVLLQTSLRAALAKAHLLIQTGVLPGDVTAIDRIMEAGMSEMRGKIDPKLSEVIQKAESRRKILDAAEQMKEIPPDILFQEMQSVRDEVA